MDEESKAAIGDRIKPLPSTEGMDDEQLRQLARELHSAIDKVCFKIYFQVKQLKTQNGPFFEPFRMVHFDTRNSAWEK